MGGASRQNDGAAVAASTEKLNTHSADIMRVDVLTAHTPFCPLAAWLRTLITWTLLHIFRLFPGAVFGVGPARGHRRGDLET